MKRRSFFGKLFAAGIAAISARLPLKSALAKPDYTGYCTPPSEVNPEWIDAPYAQGFIFADGRMEEGIARWTAEGKMVMPWTQ